MSLTVCLLSGVQTAAAQATPYIDLHDFGGTVTNADGLSGSDGGYPQAGVTFDAAGNMYGTTSVGGTNTLGNVWEITKAGTYIDLHDFGGTVTNANGQTGPDGGYSQAGVTFDSSGNMYGTTAYGGPTNLGILWEITKAGSYHDLHDFGGTVTNADEKIGPDGLAPYAAVTLDSNGNLYGTASGGGPRYNGMVWEFTKAGTYIDLHDFGNTTKNADGKNGPDGSDPNAGIVFDAAGDMYGTTDLGGPYDASAAGDGIVWEITKEGVYRDLHDFGGTVENANGKRGPDGYNSSSTVVIDAAGNLYGTAENGGANTSVVANERGILWEITKAGAYRDLHDFGGVVTDASGTTGPDGGYPAAAVLFDSMGNMFGTAENSGAYQYGMVWELTSSGSYHDLHDFGGVALNSDGVSQADGDIAGAQVAIYAGNLYGTTIFGGTNDVSSDGDGIVWELGTAVDVPSLSLSPTSVWGGFYSTGTVALAFPLANDFVVKLTSSSADAQVPTSVVIPAGADSAPFSIKTTAVQKNITAKIVVTVPSVEGSESAFANLTVESPLINGPLSLITPTSVLGGSSATGYITLTSPAPIGGTKVSLFSLSPVAKVPAYIIVPAGATNSPTFTVTTIPVAKSTIPEITSTLPGYSWTWMYFTVAAPSLYSFTLNPTSVTGGAMSKATVTIGSVAPPGGLKVTISSNSKSANVPVSVTIPAGKTTATFTVNTSAVTTQTPVEIQVSLNGGTFTGFLTINP